VFSTADTKTLNSDSILHRLLMPQGNLPLKRPIFPEIVSWHVVFADHFSGPDRAVGHECLDSNC